MNRKYLIFFCFLISPTSGFGQIVLHDENELIEVTQFEYFIDTTARLDLNEVLKDNSDENFINYNNDNQIEINPNYTYWIRFSLLNNSDILQQWVLDFYDWSYVTVYEISGNEKVKSHSTGHLIRFSDRDYPKGDFNFILINLKEGNTRTYYAVLKPVLNGRLVPSDLSFKVHTKASADNTETSHRTFITTMLAIYLIIFLYNLAVFSSIRDRVYFYYLVVLVLGIITLPSNQVGGYLVSIFKNSDWAPHVARNLTAMGYTLGAASLTIFMTEFLKVKERHKGWNKLFMIFIVIDLLLIPVILVDFELGKNIAAPITLLLGIFTFIYAGISIYQKFPSATYFFVGHSLLWIGGIISIMETTDVIASNFYTQFSTQFGLVAEMIILTFALANQMNELRKQNLESNTRLEEEEKAHKKSQKLLLNILPESTAEELLEKGYSAPKNYKKVSILFADIKGYTQISEKISSSDLVEALNECFAAFDEIVVRNNMEKIKTIGDAYMCAGGVPIENETNPIDAVKAALEFQEFIRNWTSSKKFKDNANWQLRVGIHSGPVTTGVLGKTKFAYDIWGDSVNIASRIETHGEPDKVTISASTYDHVKDYFICSYRGKVHVKNKGEIDMYTVEGPSHT